MASKLTDSQVKALTGLAGKLFADPEALKTILADPRQALMDAGISENEIDAVLEYMKSLQSDVQMTAGAQAVYWMG